MTQSRENKIRKVLIVARAFPPFLPVGHSIRAIKFIKYLPALNWLPIVLTVNDQKEYETMRKVGSETLLSEIRSHVEIYRAPAGELSMQFIEKERAFAARNRFTSFLIKFFDKGRRWISRNLLWPDQYITWLPFALKMGIHIIRSEGINTIFVTCPPHSSTLLGALLKLFTGKPLVLDFRDDWIDTPWHLSKNRVTRMIERAMEGWVVKIADKVILVTDWSKNAFLNRYPAQPRDKFVCISNGVDLTEFTGLALNAPVLHNSTFTIFHAGSLNDSKSWGRDPSGFFRAIYQVLQQEPELKEKLTLVFAGDLPEVHQQMANELGLSKVIKWLGHIPHDDILKWTKSADLLLAINYEGWSTLIPGKIYEYWAAGGAPILLLSCPGAAADFVKQHRLGFAVDPFDVIGIQHAILSVYHQSKMAAPLRLNTVGIEVYDRRSLTCKLAQVLSMAV